MSGSEGVPGILGRIEASARCQFLGDARHVDAAQPMRLNLAIPVNGSEQRAHIDAGRLYPMLDVADGASFRVRSVRDTILRPSAT